MKRKTKTFWSALPADMLLVFAGLYGSVFSFLTAFDLAVDTPALLLGLAGFTLFFTLLFFLKGGWWRYLCLAGAALVLAAAALLRWDTVVLGAVGTAHRVWEAYAAAFPFLPAPAALETPAEALVPAVTLLFLLLSALLACYLAWGMVSVRVFWPEAALTFSLCLLPALTITEAPDLLPMTALLAFYGVGLMGRLLDREDRRGRARTTYAALPLTLAVLLVLRLLLPEAGYQRPVWVEEQRLELTDLAARLGQALLLGDSSGMSSLLAGESSGEVDLSAAGPLDFQGRTVLRVESEFTGHIYLRGLSSGDYTGDGWVPLPDEVYAQGLAGLDDGDGTGEWSTLWGGWQPMNFPALADQAAFPERESLRVEVENVAADPGLVYVPYHLETTPERMSGAVFRQDSYLARSAGIWNYVLYVRPYSNPLEGGTLTGRAAYVEREYGRFAQEAYTRLPEDLYVRSLYRDYYQWEREHGHAYLAEHGVDGTGITTPDAASRYTVLSLARLVAGYLEDTCVYDPETPLTPEGEDFVTYFLQESQRGYCMHFASAATVLLRAMGIPARYVTGYVADVRAGRTVDVPDYNAHAWVEVYLDGYGWYPVEVTPGFDGDFPWETGTAEEPEPVEPTPSPSPSPTPRPSAAPTLTPAPGEGPGKEGPEESPLDLRWLWAPAAALLLAALASARRRLARAGRERRFAGPDTNAAVIHAYRYLERVLRWGREEMDPALLALARKAKFSQHTLTEEERDAFVSAARAAARRIGKGLPWYRRAAYFWLAGLD